MVSILGWLLLALLVSVPVGWGLLSLRRHKPQHLPPEPVPMRVRVQLHAIRQRLNLHQYKGEVWRAGTRARRELQAELRAWDQWEEE